MARSTQQGLTLIELMTVILIAGVLLTLAVPGLQSLSNRSQQLNAVGNISAMLARARSEAVTLYKPVVLCSSDDGAGCSGDLGWEQGWLMFVDDNGNKELDEGETIIQVGQPLPRGSTLTAMYFGGYDQVVLLAFRKDGMVDSPGTFRYCVYQGSVATMQAINVGVSGQARIATDTDSDGKLKNNAGAAIAACP